MTSRRLRRAGTGSSWHALERRTRKASPFSGGLPAAGRSASSRAGCTPKRDAAPLLPLKIRVTARRADQTRDGPCSTPLQGTVPCLPIHPTCPSRKSRSSREPTRSSTQRIQSLSTAQPSPFRSICGKRPRRPISSTVKAMLWFAGDRCGPFVPGLGVEADGTLGPKRLAPVQRVDSRGGNTERDDRHRRPDRLLLSRGRGVAAGRDPVEMHTEGRKGIVELTTANRDLPVFA